jgi:6-phospho-3-hexuloisomerase
VTVIATALDELRHAIESIDPAAKGVAIDRILAAKGHHLMGYGCGREALQLRGFIMRLHHLGLSVSMQGDMTAPALGPEDLLLVTAGPGNLSTVRALMEQAGTAGADRLLITAVSDAPLAELATQTLILPTTTMANDQTTQPILPMGSLFEGALFLLFEWMVLDLRERLGETAETMRARHTNME